MLSKKQCVRGVSKATTYLTVPIGETTNINDESNPTKSSENTIQSIQKVIKAALESIKKKVIDINTDWDDDFTFLALFKDLQVQELPPIKINALDDESALTPNDSDIELW